MTTWNAALANRPGARRIGLAPAAALVAAALLAGWYSIPTQALAQPTASTEAAPPAATTKPASYPAPGQEPVVRPSSRTEFPAGAEPISGPEIVAALSDHTALLPGGFVEYYAPDGKVHGLAEDKRYGGSWEVRDGTFCTVLQDSSDSICSPVERKGGSLYWSTDGEAEASQVIVTPGNPRNLQ